MKIHAPTEHKALWMWLSENPNKEKEDWPKWLNIPSMDNDCFACEIANCDCEDCPIIWPTIDYDNNYPSCENIFGAWDDEILLAKRSMLARYIANLPWKKEYTIRTDNCEIEEL